MKSCAYYEQEIQIFTSGSSSCLSFISKLNKTLLISIENIFKKKINSYTDAVRSLKHSHIVQLLGVALEIIEMYPLVSVVESSKCIH